MSRFRPWRLPATPFRPWPLGTGKAADMRSAKIWAKRSAKRSKGCEERLAIGVNYSVSGLQCKTIRFLATSQSGPMGPAAPGHPARGRFSGSSPYHIVDLERLVEAEVETVLPLLAHAVVEAKVRARLSHDE